MKIDSVVILYAFLLKTTLYFIYFVLLVREAILAKVIARLETTGKYKLDVWIADNSNSLGTKINVPG